MWQPLIVESEGKQNAYISRKICWNRKCWTSICSIWHGSLDALPSCELSVLFFSLFSYFLFVFSELALLNLSGAVFECIDKSPCTWYVIWGRFGLSGLKQMLVVHHLSLRSWACEGIWVKAVSFCSDCCSSFVCEDLSMCRSPSQAISLCCWTCQLLSLSVWFFGNLKEKTLAGVQNGGIREVLEGMWSAQFGFLVVYEYKERKRSTRVGGAVWLLENPQLRWKHRCMQCQH